MSKEDKRWLVVIAIIVLAILLWIFLHKNPALEKAINSMLPNAGVNGGGDTYNVSVPGYIPASMPSLSKGKCDSNSPCIFCSIPNAAYPSTPIKTVAPATYATVNAIMPRNSGPVFSEYPTGWIGLSGSST